MDAIVEELQDALYTAEDSAVRHIKKAKPRRIVSVYSKPALKQATRIAGDIAQEVLFDRLFTPEAERQGRVEAADVARHEPSQQSTYRPFAKLAELVNYRH